MEFTAELKKQMVNYDLPQIAIQKLNCLINKNHHSNLEINTKKGFPSAETVLAWFDMALFIIEDMDCGNGVKVQSCVQNNCLKVSFDGYSNALTIYPFTSKKEVFKFANDIYNEACIIQ